MNLKERNQLISGKKLNFVNCQQIESKFCAKKNEIVGISESYQMTDSVNNIWVIVLKNGLQVLSRISFNIIQPQVSNLHIRLNKYRPSTLKLQHFTSAKSPSPEISILILRMIMILLPLNSSTVWASKFVWLLLKVALTSMIKHEEKLDLVITKWCVVARLFYFAVVFTATLFDATPALSAVSPMWDEAYVFGTLMLNVRGF